MEDTARAAHAEARRVHRRGATKATAYFLFGEAANGTPQIEALADAVGVYLARVAGRRIDFRVQTWWDARGMRAPWQSVKAKDRSCCLPSHLCSAVAKTSAYVTHDRRLESV